MLTAAALAAGYRCVVDARPREGERTDRGMLFAAKTDELYRIGLETLRRSAGMN